MDTESRQGWLTGLLTGWGIKESWAKIIVGALVGALTAAGVLSNTSCSAIGGSAITLTSPTYGSITVTLPSKDMTVAEAKAAVAEATPDAEHDGTVVQSSDK